VTIGTIVTEDVVIGLERLGISAARMEPVVQAVIRVEQVRALKAMGLLPPALGPAERQAEEALARATRRYAQDARPAGLVAERFAPDVLAKLSRRMVLQSLHTVHTLERSAEKQLAGATLKYWQQLSLRPEFAAFNAKLGRGGFEELVSFGSALRPALAKDFEAGIVYTLKGRSFELVADMHPMWQAALTAAGERGARLLQMVPEPMHWAFSYQRTDVRALAFSDLQKAATPAPLLDALAKVSAADLELSNVTTNLLQWVDKSAWMIYDDGAMRVGLPLLFGESKGLRNLRDLVKQFPGDIERGGLGYALIDGKPTLVMLIPALTQPELIGIAPRSMTAGQVRRTVARTGAVVRSLDLGVDNKVAIEYCKSLGIMMGLRR
jgi:hypothetical protein